MNSMLISYHLPEPFIQDNMNNNWLYIGTLAENYPTAVTAIFADGYSPTGAPDSSTDPYMYQWLKPQDATVVGYYENSVGSIAALASVLPAYNSISWDSSEITSGDVNKMSTFDDRYRSIEATNTYNSGGYTAVLLAFETGFGKVINQSVEDFKISTVLKLSASVGSPVHRIAVWDFGSSGWDSNDEIGTYISGSSESDGTDGYEHYRFNSGFAIGGKTFVSDDGYMYIAVCVRDYRFAHPVDVDFDIKYVDLTLLYDVDDFIQSNIYTVIEAVDFRCISTTYFDRGIIILLIGLVILLS